MFGKKLWEIQQSIQQQAQLVGAKVTEAAKQATSKSATTPQPLQAPRSSGMKAKHVLFRHLRTSNDDAACICL
jgi:hypothetical protein